ncbi:hypothetical protein LCGC14_1238760 [marine sediment metagenome]|uniref:H-type lectin domain-containing protein n=1 Tax=marine sediment metagenome TaxID=412755 RepID=A0A0F9L6M8_9ZZZZ
MKIAHIKITGGQNDITLAHGEETVTEDSFTAVSFPYALPQIPHVMATPISTDSGHTATVSNVTVNGFTIYLNKQGGGGADDVEVSWIAVS